MTSSFRKSWSSFLTEQPISGQPPIFHDEVGQRAAAVLPGRQFQNNERLIRLDEVMLWRRYRLRAVGLRRLYVARAAAADPVEGRQRELVPRAALQALEEMRALTSVQHDLLPFGEFSTISQKKSLNRRATVVALLPL